MIEVHYDGEETAVKVAVMSSETFARIAIRCTWSESRYNASYPAPSLHFPDSSRPPVPWAHDTQQTENKLPNIDVHDQCLVLDMVHNQVGVDRRLQNGAVEAATSVSRC